MAADHDSRRRHRGRVVPPDHAVHQAGARPRESAGRRRPGDRPTLRGAGSRADGVEREGLPPPRRDHHVSRFVYDGPIVAVDSASGSADTDEHVERDVRREEHAVTPGSTSGARAQAEDLRRRGRTLAARDARVPAAEAPRRIVARPAATTTGTTTPDPAAPVRPATATPVALVGAAPTSAATTDKLTSFSVFAAKDPFVQQVVTENGARRAPLEEKLRGRGRARPRRPPGPPRSSRPADQPPPRSRSSP